MRYFTRRNRIISGIANAIIIAECRLKSGSSSTATYAFSQNRKVYCIPQRIDSAAGIGTNELINRGAGIIISSKQLINELYNDNKKKIDLVDIKEEYNTYVKMNNNKISILEKSKLGIQSNRDTETSDKKIKQPAKINIPNDYITIYQLLTEKSMSNEAISRSLNTDIAEINYKLTMMEIEGYIIKKEGNLFSIN